MTRRWFALGVLAMAVLLIGVDGTVLALATPFISADLGATGTQILWIGDIYSFVLAGLLISMGSLGDRIGHKKLLLCGATAFAAISAITAYSHTPEMLILTRALLGMIVALFVGQAVAWSIKLVLRDHFQKRKLEIDREHLAAVTDAEEEQGAEQPAAPAETG